jgi:uncharacterized membrane protein YedE/YeeE
MRIDKNAWNPYMAGAATGLLAVASVALTNKYLGASTTFVRGAGMLERLVSPELVASLSYYVKEKPVFDWQFLFVIGIFLGALLAAVLFRDFTWQAVPNSWKEHFGPGFLRRAVTAFGGGIIAMFGARLAGGCPSGHGLSGISQMAVSGFLSGACFFVGGIVMARLVYGRK